MDVGNRYEQLTHYNVNFLFVKASLFNYPLEQFPSRTVLHHEVHVFFILIGLVESRNVGVVQSFQDFQFRMQLSYFRMNFFLLK